MIYLNHSYNLTHLKLKLSILTFFLQYKSYYVDDFIKIGFLLTFNPRAINARLLIFIPADIDKRSENEILYKEEFCT